METYLFLFFIPLNHVLGGISVKHLSKLFLLFLVCIIAATAFTGCLTAQAEAPVPEKVIAAPAAAEEHAAVEAQPEAVP